MHPADHDPIQQPSLPNGILMLGSEPEVEATIASLKEHFERVRQHEVKRSRGRLGQLSSAQENAIESLTHSIIDQILANPITVLKAASQDDDSFVVVKTVHRVFSLSVGCSGSPDGNQWLAQ